MKHMDRNDKHHMLISADYLYDTVISLIDNALQYHDMGEDELDELSLCKFLTYLQDEKSKRVIFERAIESEVGVCG